MNGDADINLRDRLVAFEIDYNDRLEHDTLADLTDADKSFAKVFTEKLAEEKTAAGKPRVLQPWMGDPTTPLYLRPPYKY